MTSPPAPIREISSREFLHDLRRSRSAQHAWIPPAGSMELTSRCNLACRHCYLHGREAARREMSTRDACRVLDILADHGLLFLLLTGGEPLLRPDFAQIYEHAQSRGIVVNVFTNATAVTPGHVDLFGRLPPRRIEVTLYGASAPVYEQVTRVRGSFDAFGRGLEALLATGVPVTLKAMLLASNVHELAPMRSLAEEHGCRFRCDCIVTPALNGSPAPLRERLPPATVARLESAAPDAPQALCDLAMRRGATSRDAGLFRCGFGTNTFHVDAAGALHGCLMWRSDPFALLENGLTPDWNARIARLRTQAASGDCAACPLHAICSICPALAALETGTADRAPAFHCELARLRDVRARAADSNAACLRESIPANVPLYKRQNVPYRAVEHTNSGD